MSSFDGRVAEISRRNERFTEEELGRYEDFFDKVEAFPLDSQQRLAIVRDEDRNLVVAGAGSGKTSTIVGKVAYTLHAGLASPEEVLVMAFNKKAAEEVQTRISARGGGAVRTSTFHAFGLNVIAQAEQRKPSASKLGEKSELEKHIEGTLSRLLLDARFAENVRTYFDRYLYPRRSRFDFEDDGEFQRYLASIGLETLRGERVKSFEECEMANWLFRNGIRYEYERPYIHDTATVEYAQYRPDFHLPDHGIWIEHFGLNWQLETAPGIDTDKYMAGIQWKLEVHAKHGTKMITTFSFDRDQGGITEALRLRLSSVGVLARPLSDEEFLAAATGTGAVSRLAALMATSVTHYKSRSPTRQALLEKADSDLPADRIAAFLDVLEPIFETYQRTLAEAREVDFIDMIATATKHIEVGNVNVPLKYLVVDEFQDLGADRARLIQALLDRNPECRLFCVGDDWQAINRFAGADIGFMTHFERHFGEGLRHYLEKTYRFNDQIAALSSRFVLANPSQIAKTIQAARSVSAPAVSVVFIERSEQEAINELLEQIRSAREGASVLFLGRYRWVASRDKHAKERAQGLDVQALTVHSAKGREADFAIILGVSGGRTGFPCAIEDDPLASLMLPDTEPVPYAEERRLFYVALTRARHHVYVMASADKPSPFVDELCRSPLRELIEVVGPPPIPCRDCAGMMKPRQGRAGMVFWGCNTYPACDSTLDACPRCLNAPVSPGEGRFACVDEACGFVAVACPSCDSGWLKIVNGSYGEFVGCSAWQNGCRYKENDVAAFRQRYPDAA
jgi:DNA helicase-4